ncbi:MAG: BMC domain-containing protein [Clostridia bacterium]|nr:BMC domain-containing protein [Clostridia bacterium]MBQ3927984.1 BMC domain-containing protein [Clostridia bacterium]
MYQTVGVIELKSIATGIEATDAALKSAGVRLISAHPVCPGKFEIMVSGSIADVTASLDHVKERFAGTLIDASLMGRIDPQVITALYGTQTPSRHGSLGIIETYSAASIVKAADIAVKTAKVEIFELRLSRGMGGKGIVLVTGDVGDVTAAVEAGARHAKEQSMLNHYTVIAAPHEELWDTL